jgi:hypothetical protein
MLFIVRTVQKGAAVAQQMQRLATDWRQRVRISSHARVENFHFSVCSKQALKFTNFPLGKPTGV